MYMKKFLTEQPSVSLNSSIITVPGPYTGGGGGGGGGGEGGFEGV